MRSTLGVKGGVLDPVRAPRELAATALLDPNSPATRRNQIFLVDLGAGCSAGAAVGRSTVIGVADIVVVQQREGAIGGRSPVLVSRDGKGMQGLDRVVSDLALYDTCFF